MEKLQIDDVNDYYTYQSDRRDIESFHTLTARSNAHDQSPRCFSDTDTDHYAMQGKPNLKRSSVEQWNAYHSISASEEESPPRRTVHKQAKEIKSLKTAFSASMPVIPRFISKGVTISSDSDGGVADVGDNSHGFYQHEHCKYFRLNTLT